MKILVVGGSLFLGKGIVKVLQSHGHEIFILNRGNHQMNGVIQITANRENESELENALAEFKYFNLVVDTCCYTYDQAQKLQYVLADRFEHFINISSASVYSEIATPPYKESDIRNGNQVWGSYSKDKALVDGYLMSLNRKITCLIPPYLYGINNYLDRECLLWAMILSGKLIYIPNNGETQLHFITPEEIGEIILAVYRCGIQRQVLNVASAAGVISIKNYVKILFEIAEKKPNIVELDYNKFNLQPREFFSFRDIDMRLNIDLLKSKTNWNMDIDVRLGLAMEYANLDKDILVKKWKNNSIYNFMLKR